ncbi:hypothetical protein FQR65_LT10562 [Abscondita terminalis]|nr:hypothetical protein FQR65_LT10562 [Abscondita terminalis]
MSGNLAILKKQDGEQIQTCLEYVTKYSNKADQHKNVLQRNAKEYCEIDAEHTRCKDALNATYQYFQTKEDTTEEVQEVYNKYLSEQEIDSYENHPIWQKLNETSNVTDEEQSEEGEDDENMFEEGIVPSQFEPPIDPITKRPIKDPCRNRKCHHVYEYDSIMDHLNNIKVNKGKPRCPYIGCTNKNMNVKGIIKDTELKQQILNYSSSQLEQSKEEENVSVTEIF